MQFTITRVSLLLLSISVFLGSGCQPTPSAQWGRDTSTVTPVFPREYRGVWVATVANIDWPTTRNLSVDQQRQEMNAILDRCQELHLNSVVFQVRPSCDALYKSDLEPWSAYLTGQSGKAPEVANYDPLKEWCDGAHKRGMELHAWVNPFRAKHLGGEKTESSPTHISRTHPEWVRHYGGFLWLDPGIPEARGYSLAVLKDIVKRYDIDGIHVDDYFYPYPELDKEKKPMPFPDGDAYAKYGNGMTLSDWRRDNIDQFMEAMYRQTKALKKDVQVGISPFGIWRPKNPAQIEGFDSYDKIYCDSKKWLNEGWLDYCTPQLYWPIAQKPQSFPVLLDWWIDQNTQHRQVWPGLYTGRVSSEEGPKIWKASEVVNQIAETRKRADRTSPGVIHFSMKCLMKDTGGITDTLEKASYAQAALVPATTWLGADAPATPSVSAKADADNAVSVKLSPGGFLWFGKEPREWAVAVKHGETWKYYTMPGSQRTATFHSDATVGRPEVVSVMAVGKLGATSKAVMVRK